MPRAQTKDFVVLKTTPLWQLVPTVRHSSLVGSVTIEVDVLECPICSTRWIPLGTGICTECRVAWQVAVMSGFLGICCMGQFGDAFSSRLPVFDEDILDWQVALVEVHQLYLEEFAGFMCWTVDSSWNMLLLACTEALCMSRVGESRGIPILVPRDLERP